MSTSYPPAFQQRVRDACKAQGTEVVTPSVVAEAWPMSLAEATEFLAFMRDRPRAIFGSPSE